MAATQKETYCVSGLCLALPQNFRFRYFGDGHLAATEPSRARVDEALLDGSFVDRDMDTVETVAILLVAVFAVRGLTGF